MECIACTRIDSTKPFYCVTCLRKRLTEYQQKRQQIKQQLQLYSTKASNLLSVRNSQTNPLPVREESILKAERWTTSVRLRDTRIAIQQEKGKVEQLTLSLEARRRRVQQRKSNLSTAKSLLESLTSSDSPSSAPLAPPSLSSLERNLTQLSNSITNVDLELSRVRRILTLELLTVFQFHGFDPPLEDPFLPVPFTSTSKNKSIPSSRKTTTISRRKPQIYTLTTLPLPPLSKLSTLLFHQHQNPSSTSSHSTSSFSSTATTPTTTPTTTTIEPLLTSLSHLVRLLSLYEHVETLPFVPSLTTFGNGKSGVSLRVGGTSAREGGLEGEEEEEEEEGEGKDGGKRRKRKTTRVGLEKAVRGGEGFESERSYVKLEGGGEEEGEEEKGRSSWPLFFNGSLDTIVDQRGGGKITTTMQGLKSREGVSSKKKNEGIHMRNGEKDGQEGGSSSMIMMKKRFKLVMTGAIALAYDLAYISWVRENRTSRIEGEETDAMAKKKKGRRRREWKVEDLDDLGYLIKRAAGVLDHELSGSESDSEDEGIEPFCEGEEDRGIPQPQRPSSNLESSPDPFAPINVDDPSSDSSPFHDFNDPDEDNLPPSFRSPVVNVDSTSSIATLKPNLSSPNNNTTSTILSPHNNNNHEKKENNDEFPLSFESVLDHYLSINVNSFSRSIESSSKSKSKPKSAKKKKSFNSSSSTTSLTFSDEDREEGVDEEDLLREGEETSSFNVETRRVGRGTKMGESSFVDARISKTTTRNSRCKRKGVSSSGGDGQSIVEEEEEEEGFEKEDEEEEEEWDFV